MKIKSLLTAILLLLSIALTACSSDEHTAGNPKPNVIIVQPNNRASAVQPRSYATARVLYPNAQP